MVALREAYQRHYLIFNLLIGILMGLLVFAPLFMFLDMTAHIHRGLPVVPFLEMYGGAYTDLNFYFILFGAIAASMFSILQRRTIEANRRFSRVNRNLIRQRRARRREYRKRQRMEAEVKEWEERFQQSEKMASISLLAMGVAHEVNNPLTNIALLAESIKRRIADEAARGKLETLQREVETASAAVQRLLDYSVERGPATLRPTTLGDTVAEAVRYMERRKPAGVRVVQDIRCADAVVLADRSQVQQLLINLMGNGFDAMPGGGTATVRLERAEGKIVLSVIDTGSGIPAENMGKLFEPFFTTKKGGTGLGLALCREIARAHNAAIDVTSAEGKGTTVTLKFDEVIMGDQDTGS